MSSIGIGIVGFGKIAKDQHVGTIRASEHFFLHSVADPAIVTDAVQQYSDVDAMLESSDPPDAIVVCTPPQVRFDIARKALTRHSHVLLEKPPCVTVSEGEMLRELALESRVTLFCAWHSQFSPAVIPAQDWLSLHEVQRVRINWREDVRIWHPGQAWIWESNGFGVFDPGINALSIATKILPRPLMLQDALLRIPEDCDTPVSAELALTDANGVEIAASFDFLQTGRQTWEIEIETDRGPLVLLEGGNRLMLQGIEQKLRFSAEYDELYRHFARLIAANQSDIDLAPLQLVNDALLHGQRETVAPLELYRSTRSR